MKHDIGFRYMQHLDSLLHVINAEADSLSRLKRGEKQPERAPQSNFLKTLLSNPVSQLIFWVLLAVFIVYVLFRLFHFNPFLRQESTAPAAAIAPLEALQTPGWYEIQVAEAEAEKNFRYAIRLRFMQLLAVWDEKGWIEFLPEKTNSSYIREIKSADMKNHFSHLARVFEYVWYGKKEIREDQYEIFRSMFEKSEVYK